MGLMFADRHAVHRGEMLIPQSLVSLTSSQKAILGLCVLVFVGLIGSLAATLTIGNYYGDLFGHAITVLAEQPRTSPR